MKSSTGENYRKRLIRVVDYIYQNLGEKLDVNTLADIACMSPYHFHRIYRQIAQETVNVTVRRLRLQAAASDLIRTERSLQEIAHTYGYTSQEAFTRAFNKEFGDTPGEYRANKCLNEVTWEPYVAVLPGSKPSSQREHSTMFSVEIIDLPETEILGLRHTGDYMLIGQAFEKLEQYAAIHQLYNASTRSIGVYYDDPSSVATDKLRSMAGITVDSAEENPEAGIETLQIPAGRYATLLFKGSYAELEQPYDWLFGEWLPESGYEAGNFPPFEEYLNNPKTTQPSELLTRIHCLLAS
jgi:AraC family transcriptional regulator